jgi:outer membrane receptor for ferrienterochelin and colicins
MPNTRTIARLACLAAVLLATVFLSPPRVRADAASEAALHNRLASELYQQRRYEEALQHFLASNRLVPNPNIVFNIAQTYGVLRRDADAFNWYETYLAFDGLDTAALERGRGAQAVHARRVGVMEVVTTPAGAALFVDRVELGSVGVSPRRIAVSPGPHRIVARLDGHHDATSEEVRLVAGRVEAVALSLTAVVGVLVVETDPPGATLRRLDDGTELGTTPFRGEVAVGTWQVQLVRDGYAEQQRTVTVAEGTEARVSVSMVMEASRVAVLTVDGAPEGARVRLGDRVLGVTPISVPGLDPGTFNLEIDLPNHTPYRGSVLLEPGAATRVEFHLVDPSHGPSPRLRWLGYGGGAALVVIGGALGLSARAARNDFYDQPSRDAYDTVHRRNAVADGLMISGVIVAVATLIVDLIVDKPTTRARVTVER